MSIVNFFIIVLFQWTPVGTTVISSIAATDPDPSDRGYLSYAISQESRFAVSQ